MTLNIDLKKILRTFDTIKQELLESIDAPQILTFKDAQNQLGIREIQLKTVLEISEKLIHHFESASSSLITENPQFQELSQKYSELQKLYEYSDLTISQFKAELKSLKNENQSLINNSGISNLFTVEVYQSEIEDLKKEYAENVNRFQTKIEELENTSLRKKFKELQVKYCFLKEQLGGCRRKVEDLEEIISKNNEYKKITDAKYYELVNTHKKMFEYIEKLEVKVRKFQGKHYKGNSLNASTLSRDSSLGLCSRITDESRSFNLSISGPISIFSA